MLIIASSSLLVNHVMSYYHDKLQHYNQKREDALRGVLEKLQQRALEKRTVWNHSFAGYNKKGRRQVMSSTSMFLLTGLNLGSRLALMGCIFLPLVTFDMSGLIGLLISTVDRPLATKTYSVFDLLFWLINRLQFQESRSLQ